MRAKVEHPFRVIKRQFGLAKVRFRGLAKNTAHVITLFALSNLWMARKKLIAMAVLRPQTALEGKKRGAMHLKRSTRQPSCNSVRFERLNASAFSRCSDLP